ncbi:MAG: ROK family protein [Clostridia bacterium]|nr:ROK family protein [Clostridia bacterium]
MERLIGLDIGGTKSAVVRGACHGDTLRVTAREAFPTAECPAPGDALARMAALIDKLCPEGAPEAIGISCGGPLDSARGLILSPPNLPGWDHVPVARYFAERFAAPAALQNDANACAVAEWRFGAGRGTRHMAFLTCGTGLGAGLILGGRLYGGASGMAGEAGHIRLERFGPVGYGKAGSFEGFCSGGGIAQLAGQALAAARQRGERIALEDTLCDAKSVFALARSGDPPCLAIVDTVARSLGRGLAVLIDILNLEVIVAGGIYARNADLLYPAAWETVQAEALPAAVRACRLAPAALGEAIGDMAALSAALGALYPEEML